MMGKKKMMKGGGKTKKYMAGGGKTKKMMAKGGTAGGKKKMMAYQYLFLMKKIS